VSGGAPISGGLATRLFASPRLVLGVGLLLLGIGDLVAIDSVWLPRHLAGRAAVFPRPPAPPAAHPAPPPPVAAPAMAPAAPARPAPVVAEPAIALAPAPPPVIIPEPAQPEPPSPEPSSAESSLPPLLFYRSTAWLSPAAQKTLSQLASMLKEDPSLEVVLTGHTDNFGPSRFNRVLSLKRAWRARYSLTVLGIDRERVQIQGLGSTQPADETPTAQARARNRRVEIALHQRSL
jgi:outer membrane protein OmpA-like peptidoglycan-associated protein